MNRRELFPAVAIGGASALLTGAGLGALAVSTRYAPTPAPAAETASAALTTAIEGHRAALAAIRLVLWEEETCGHHEGFATNTLRAALTYFDGRA